MDYVVEGTDEFRAMAPLKRNCLYPEEEKLKHFPAYSEPNCVLECAWQHAAIKCGCAPFFLHSHHPEVNTCEAHGNQCFSGIVKGRYDLLGNKCMEDCLPDCETVEYKISPPEKEKKYSQGL